MNIDGTKNHLQSYLILGVCGLAAVLFFISGFQSNDAVAMDSIGEYLPLKEGNSWYLTSPISDKPIILSVAQKDGQTTAINFDNPWFKSLMKLREEDGKHLLTSLSFDGNEIEMPSDTIYFDFTAAKGATWTNALGKLKIVERNKTVEANGSTYENCIQIRETNLDTGDYVFWTFAPGVGFVQFGEGAAAFYLDLSRSTIDADTAGNVVSAETTSPDLSEVKLKEDRILSIAITMSDELDFNRAFDTAKSAGMQEQGGLLNINWNDLEKSPGKLRDNGDLEFSNQFYPGRNTRVSVTIAPIQTNQLVLPEDLEGKPLDHPDVIQRYNALVDFVFTKIPDLGVTSFSVGNEVDAYLGGDKNKWDEYVNFFKATRAHIKKNHPDLLVGVKVTHEGLLHSAKTEMLKLNKKADVIMVTYYPLKSDMTVRPPAVVWDDFDALVSLYPDKPIFVLEAGYPSSGVLGSSEKKQEEFVRNVFAAWDKHSDNIKLVDFTWLHDVSGDTLQEMSQFYGSKNANFLAFLGTLGLKTNDGRSKRAFNALKQEAQARGWE